MRSFPFLSILLLCSACSVVHDADDPDGTGDADGTSDEGTVEGESFKGTPCRFLAGDETLPSWTGNQGDDVYPLSLFSFELDSSDFDVVRNDGDVLYTMNMFRVNTVVDDRSFIVDLGDVPLADVPVTVDPEGFALGNWDEHDYLQAVLDHTYVIRTIDGNTDQWAALRVVGLAPGEKVSFEWIRSPTPDGLVVPTSCL